MTEKHSVQVVYVDPHYVEYSEEVILAMQFCGSLHQADPLFCFYQNLHKSSVHR